METSSQDCLTEAEIQTIITESEALSEPLIEPEAVMASKPSGKAKPKRNKANKPPAKGSLRTLRDRYDSGQSLSIAELRQLAQPFFSLVPAEVCRGQSVIERRVTNVVSRLGFPPPADTGDDGSFARRALQRARLALIVANGGAPKCGRWGEQVVASAKGADGLVTFLDSADDRHKCIDALVIELGGLPSLGNKGPGGGGARRGRRLSKEAQAKIMKSL